MVKVIKILGIYMPSFIYTYRYESLISAAPIHVLVKK